jgi:hypothetical protein
MKLIKRLSNALHLRPDTSVFSAFDRRRNESHPVRARPEVINVAETARVRDAAKSKRSEWIMPCSCLRGVFQKKLCFDDRKSGFAFYDKVSLK